MWKDIIGDHCGILGGIGGTRAQLRPMTVLGRGHLDDVLPHIPGLRPQVGGDFFRSPTRVDNEGPPRRRVLRLLAGGRTTEQRIVRGGYPPGHEKRVHIGTVTDGLSGGHLGKILAQISLHTRYDGTGGRSAEQRIRDAVVAVAQT